MTGDTRAAAAPVVLAASYLLALGVRLAHAAANPPLLWPRGDNTFFEATARSVAAGDWGRLPTMDGGTAISVKFPPAWGWTLGLGDRLLWFVPTDTSHVLVSAAVAATVVPLAGLLVWRTLARAEPRIRLGVTTAATLLAVGHPLLLGPSTARMSEVLVVPLGLGILLGIERILREAAGPWTLPGLGLLIAAASLTRPEALVAWGLALVVVARIEQRPAVAILPLVLATVPVLAYSAVISTHAGAPVLVSTNSASAVAGANCDRTWSGEALGHWSEACLAQVWLGRLPPADRAVVFAHDIARSDGLPPQLGPRIEHQLQDAHQRGALFAIRNDPHLFARAVPVRVARGLGMWWSADQTSLEVVEGRSEAWERAGRWVHLVVVLPAFLLAAYATARRGAARDVLDRCADRRVLLPGAAAFGVWLLGAALTHGSTRHRAAVDAIVLVGAAVGWAMILSAHRFGTDPVDVRVTAAPAPGRAAERTTESQPVSVRNASR